MCIRNEERHSSFTAWLGNQTMNILNSQPIKKSLISKITSVVFWLWYLLSRFFPFPFSDPSIFPCLPVILLFWYSRELFSDRPSVPSILLWFHPFPLPSYPLKVHVMARVFKFWHVIAVLPTRLLRGPNVTHESNTAGLPIPRVTHPPKSLSFCVPPILCRNAVRVSFWPSPVRRLFFLCSDSLRLSTLLHPYIVCVLSAECADSRSSPGPRPLFDNMSSAAQLLLDSLVRDDLQLHLNVSLDGANGTVREQLVEQLSDVAPHHFLNQFNESLLYEFLETMDSQHDRYRFLSAFPEEHLDSRWAQTRDSLIPVPRL